MRQFRGRRMAPHVERLRSLPDDAIPQPFCTALSGTALSEDAQVTRQAIVKHLQVLQRAGLVTNRKLGREALYSLETKRLEEARAFLEGISAGWDRALERLRQVVEEPKTSSRPRRRMRTRGQT